MNGEWIRRVFKAYCVDIPGKGGAFFRIPFGLGCEAERCKGTGGRWLAVGSEDSESIENKSCGEESSKGGAAILGTQARFIHCQSQLNPPRSAEICTPNFNIFRVNRVN